MLYGTVPFKASNMNELHNLIMSAKYTLKEDISEDARNLLKGMLEADPTKRLTVRRILQHQWLSEVNESCKRKI
jgi:serine/threonine protein kinase